MDMKKTGIEGCYQILGTIASLDGNDCKTVIAAVNKKTSGIRGYLYHAVNSDKQLEEDILQALHKYKQRLKAQLKELGE